jgi:hypothetical protein
MSNVTEQPGSEGKGPFFNNALMRRAMVFWFVEIGLSAINFFVLINLIYEPHLGELLAHQIGMSTRIAYVFVLSYFIVRPLKSYRKRDLLVVGVLWMCSWLVFEWGGSLAVGRPVSEIVVGWNILKGYMWPYVLATYLFSTLIVGAALHRTWR